MIKTSEQTMVESSVERFFKENLTHSSLRQLANKPMSSDKERAEIWKQISDLAWLSLLLPEEKGGIGMTIKDAVGVAEYFGQFLVPLPLSYWLVTYPFISQFELSPDLMQWIEDLVSGKQQATLGIKQRETDAIAMNYSNVNPDNPLDVWVLSHTDGVATVQIYQGIGGELSIDPLIHSGSLTDKKVITQFSWACSQDNWNTYLQQLRLVQAAELLGVAMGAFELTVEYAKEREQFGKPIGAFQGVKHPLAQDWMNLDNAKLVLLEAAESLILSSENSQEQALLVKQRSDKSELLLTIAEVLVQESSKKVTKNAIQFHGAMGITWECIIHYYLKRSLWLNSLIDQQNQRSDKLDRVWELSLSADES